MPHPVHVAVVQFQPTKGDYDGNLERLEQVFESLMSATPRPDVLSFPESALTGYFLEGGVRDVVRTADQVAADLHRAFTARCGGEVDIVLSFFEVHDNTFYNAAMYATIGGAEPVVRHVHRKMFLPTYGLFDEERFVEHGLELRAFDTRWGRAAMLLCEDAWHALTAAAVALDGAQIVFVPSASPARGAWPQPDEPVRGPASIHRWEHIARDRADEHGIYFIITQLVGSEGGKLFPGGSVVAGPSGDVRARGPLWDEGCVHVMLDLDDITRARAASPLLADLRIMLPHLMHALGEASRRGPGA
jgi:NAD+ synthase (glutamine-hydrolysing)